MDSSKKQMNDYWHIPRASLAGSASSAASSASSSNRSNKSHSNPPTVAKRASPTHSRHQHSHRNQQKMHLTVANNFPTINYGHQATKVEDAVMAVEMGVGVVDARMQKRISDSNTPPTRTQPTKIRTATTAIPRRDSELNAAAATTAAAAAAVLAAAATNKRGSRSSQGSSDSNNSTRSAASGSLLLTAANLERFAEIHKKQHQHNKLYMEGIPSVHHHQHNATTYNANLVQAISGGQRQQPQGTSCTQENGNHNDAIITMDPNLDFIKTKDLDTVSIASSMHFTMVNGEIGQTKKPKRGLCDRGRQVTVLIVSMSTIFLLLIMGMVYALEMRAREMPQS